MKAFLDLFVARRCIGCGIANVDVCVHCRRELVPIVRRDLPGIGQCRAAGAYDGWLRSALLRYKSGDASVVAGLRNVLSSVMDTTAPTFVIPVPSSTTKVVERGYDTIALLTKDMHTSRVPLLRLMREPDDQVGLTALQRRDNVHQAMRCSRAITGSVLLVDDVVTTGATLVEAARALRVAGASQINAICVCAAQIKG